MKVDNNRKQVLLLSPLPPPAGGIASWTKRLLKIGLPNGWKIVHVDTKIIGSRSVFKNTERRLTDELQRTLRIYKNTCRALKSKDIEVVHTTTACSSLGMIREIGVGIITKLYSRKFVVHCRCTVPNMVKTKKELFLFRILSSICNCMILLNEKSITFVNELNNTPTVLIPNFIPSDLTKEKNSRLISSHIKTVLYVGGVIESKGCKLIIEAAKQLPTIRFRLVGAISKNIEAMELSENVVLLGEQASEEVQKEIEAADVFLFPSFFSGEGFSNALLEAMANGLPCIVSDWAANKDMIEDKGGVVIPINDSDAIVEALRRMETQEIRRNMTNFNVEKVHALYTDEKVLKAYVSLYEKLST